jgi:WD40 repeat protein
MSGESIQSYKLQGHQGSVSCLDISEIGLLSGSEDKTARLWDLREGKRRACLCIQTEGEVMSVAFEPPRKEPPCPLEGMFAKDSSV